MKKCFEVFMKANHILDTKYEDFFKIFFPSLIIIPLILFSGFEGVAWSLIVCLSVLDIGHVFSSGVEPLFDKDVRKEKITLKLVLIGFIIASLIVLLFPENVHRIFFYSIIFHNIRQGMGITLLYYKKGEKKNISASFLKNTFYFFTVTPLLLFHLRRIFSDFGVLETIYYVLPLEDYLSLSERDVNEYLYFSYIIFFLAFALTLFFLFRRLSFKTVGSFLFFTGIYIYSYLLTENLLYSSLLLMSSHAIPYLFLIEKRVSNHSETKNLVKYSYVSIFFCVFLGFLYYTFFYKSIGEYSEMSSWTKFFVILPSYIHYSFDGYIWTQKNSRFKEFVNS